MDVFIKGNSIKSVADFHNTIKQQLNFPEYYGENLDALWDCIRCIDLPCHIIWEDHKKSKTYLDSYFEKIRDTFEEAEIELNGFKVEYR